MTTQNHVSFLEADNLPMVDPDSFWIPKNNRPACFALRFAFTRGVVRTLSVWSNSLNPQDWPRNASRRRFMQVSLNRS